MQTFLPYEHFIESAKVLDNQRLGKQRVEVLQILNTLYKTHLYQGHMKIAWQNHPAVLMWRGHEQGLINYGLAVCDEWVSRGFKDTCFFKIEDFRDKFSFFTTYPSWLGDRDFHYRHQANLLRKNFDHYSKFFGTVINPYLNYKWPVKVRK